MDPDDTAAGDAALVQRALAGDRAAFESLVRRYQPGVERLCRRLLGSPTDAQDVAQEAVLQAFLGLDTLKDPARFGAWLHAIAANLARMYRRRHRPPARLVDPQRLQLPAVSQPPSPEEAAESRELRATIECALGDLPSDYRAAVVGFYVAGYSYAELTTRLGVPISTLKWRLFHSRRALRRSLQPVVHEYAAPANGLPKELQVNDHDSIAVEVQFVGRGVTSRDPERLVMLRAVGSGHQLPLNFTAVEGDSIQDGLSSSPLAQQPHDLMLRLLTVSGSRLARIVIRRLIDDTMFADLILVRRKGERTVEARLADALALAVRAGAPILVAREVWDAMSYDPADREQQRARASDAVRRYRAANPEAARAEPVPPPTQLRPAIDEGIHRRLQQALDETGGRSAILLHRSGTVVAWQGSIVTDELAAYAAAWAAGDRDRRHELGLKVFGLDEPDGEDMVITFGSVARWWELQLVVPAKQAADETWFDRHLAPVGAELGPMLQETDVHD